MGAHDQPSLVQPSAAPRVPRLELIGITRRYPGVIANDGITLRIAAGEIHGILGENGSGKSTLMRCIYGVEQPDAGEILWNGRQIQPRSPRAARELGMAMVFQHFSLIEPLTVLENVSLYLDGILPRARSSAAIAEDLQSLANSLGLSVAPQATVATLSLGERQRVEILRCLMLDPSLLILDEPTAALTPVEVQQFFDMVRAIAGRGCSVLFISHKLPEVRALCDQVTILRRGRIAGHGVPARMSETQLATLLIGEELHPTAPARRPPQQDVLLDLRNVQPAIASDATPALQPISLQIHGGEIVGIAGIAGNGQDCLNALLSGETPVGDGQLFIGGRDMTHAGPATRYAAGLQVLPAERTHRGAVPNMSLADNLLLTNVHRYVSAFGRLDRQRLQLECAQVVAQNDVRVPEGDAPAGTLSGGNLQKFLLGRALLGQPRVLICNHPTWGVDIRAAQAIQARILEARERGAAILLITEDLEELYQLSDRIGALFAGRLSSLRPPATLPLTELGLWMTGGGEMRAQQAA